ncbi:MAG: hypothetical protein KAX49_13075 [Halanaerobiales bacterium]|nr:hypothetical protein [Halanaerobiales bacterium]
MTKEKNNPVVGLILNLVFPGLGSMVCKWKHGVLQFILTIVSVLFMLVLIGFPMYGIMWIWALITGINNMNN